MGLVKRNPYIAGQLNAWSIENGVQKTRYFIYFSERVQMVFNSEGKWMGRKI